MIGASESFTLGSFAMDTLIWTGVLIALVLVLRRPVTKAFGAPTAYALWALPALRLILPPIELPAWLAPRVEEAGVAAEEAIVVAIEPATSEPGAISEQVATPPLVADGFSSFISAIPFAEILIAIWLMGAAVFLFSRFSAYFSLRDELVENAVEVGTAKGPFGPIRLIETPGTNAPLAFGVLEPVIALPPGFMATPDRAARDLALAHELAHHRGFDLLINVLVQPLFAIHWFNPLGRFGWLALRRDQEAACDARVIGTAPKEERARYASVIASFAAGPNVALAAPMACPVLGDKSIVQRLRNLKMTEQSSNTSRRLGSRLMIGGAILALPLTASITYAESFAPEPPAPPVPTLAAFGIQAPPEAPPAPPAPDAPVPPTPPTAPEAPEIAEAYIVKIDPDEEVDVRVRRIEKELEKRHAKHAEHHELARRNAEKAHEKAMKAQEHAHEKAVKNRYKTVSVTRRDGQIEEAEMELVLEEMREGLAEADEALREAREELKALEKSEKWEALAEEGQGRTFVKMSCDSKSDEVATTIEREDGSREVLICQSRVMAQALSGLQEARKSIAESTEMNAKMRKQVLKELDRQIKDWEKETR